jgi:biotin carboxyl carrier protein
MPAVVLAVPVAEGDEVARGAVLAVVSAMLTELQLRAPCAGRVAAVRARAGDRVRPGQVIVQVDPGGGGGAHGG